VIWGAKKKQRTGEFLQRQADQEVAKRVADILKKKKVKESKEKGERDDSLSCF